MDDIRQYGHSYYAEAYAFEGDLKLPLDQKITRQAFVQLPPEGGYLNQKSCGYRVESVLSFTSAYTQVAGHRDEKKDHGYNTLVTSVVEGLNILDVVTADRVVGQISTDHRMDGYVPTISFLGTRFENLRIAGHKVKLDLNQHICGDRPSDDSSYFKGSGFASRVSQQHARIRDCQSGYPNPIAELRERFNLAPENFDQDPGGERTVEFSLVNDCVLHKEPESTYPGFTCGHVIHVPNFGTIYLAVLKLTHSDFNGRVPHKTLLELTMIDIEMGCLGKGNTQTVVAKTNGKPGTG